MTESRRSFRTTHVDVPTQETHSSLSAASFEGIYHAYADAMWRYLKRLGIPERAREDLVQEIFLVVHHKRHTFDGQRPLKPWIYGIAFRVVSDYKKKKANQEILDLEAQPSGPTHENPLDERVFAAERRRLVQRALNTLDEARRQVFVLHEFEDLTAVAIAELTRVPVNTVYSRLRSAREKFQAAVLRDIARTAPTHPPREMNS